MKMTHQHARPRVVDFRHNGRKAKRTFSGAELMDTWTWFQSGINTDGAHNPVTSRTIKAGDIMSLNCFPMVAG
jgi:creatinase